MPISLTTSGGYRWWTTTSWPTCARRRALFPALNAMLVMPEEAQFLSLLTRIIEARSILEIGTFTGYTTLCLARTLPPGGRVVTCDISEKWTRIAARYWRRAQVEDRIDLRVGNALDTLERLHADEGSDSFDFVFIDADKEQSLAYYERALTLVRPGGLIVLDNTLFFGRVIDPDAQDPATLAIRALNERAGMTTAWISPCFLSPTVCRFFENETPNLLHDSPVANESPGEVSRDFLSPFTDAERVHDDEHYG